MERSFRAVLPVYLLAATISWPVVKVGFRLRARGTEHLPEGGFVLAANHTSNFDPWPLALPLFPRRQLRFMAKSELFNPILKPILRAVELVRDGEIVVMFPEGTRRRKGLRKKHEARAHTGAARIALSADAPLVPAAIKGTDRLSRLGPLRVAYGPPIPLDDLRGQEISPAAREATERLMAEIRELEASL
jgi:1-acyl-sn-glycerol-3-phosphate acyltransferase